MTETSIPTTRREVINKLMIINGLRRNNDVFDLYKKGEKLAKIAKTFGITPTRVSQIINNQIAKRNFFAKKKYESRFITDLELSHAMYKAKKFINS